MKRSRLLQIAEVQVGSRQADGADMVVGDNATAKILAPSVPGKTGTLYQLHHSIASEPMSNRTLIEINHDYAGEIDLNDIDFVADLVSYLRAGGEISKHKLERYGVRVFGMRHHSESFEVRWGTHAKSISEPAS